MECTRKTHQNFQKIFQSFGRKRQIFSEWKKMDNIHTWNWTILTGRESNKAKVGKVFADMGKERSGTVCSRVNRVIEPTYTSRARIFSLPRLVPRTLVHSTVWTRPQTSLECSPHVAAEPTEAVPKFWILHPLKPAREKLGSVWKSNRDWERDCAKLLGVSVARSFFVSPREKKEKKEKEEKDLGAVLVIDLSDYEALDQALWHPLCRCCFCFPFWVWEISTQLRWIWIFSSWRAIESEGDATNERPFRCAGMCWTTLTWSPSSSSSSSSHSPLLQASCFLFCSMGWRANTCAGLVFVVV